MRIFRQFELDPPLFVSSAITLLILPLPWCIALIFSAGFHEICHLIALRICGCQSPQICIGPSGAVIYSAPLSIGKALLCTLAGPLGQLFLIILARWFPRLVLCATVQAIYNLLPLNDLDGGRALQYILETFLPVTTAKSVCLHINWITLLLLCILAIYATFILQLGLIPIIFAGALLIKTTSGKIPCKSQSLRVQ